jgi:hypothetical protein
MSKAFFSHLRQTQGADQLFEQVSQLKAHSNLLRVYYYNREMINEHTKRFQRGIIKLGRLQKKLGISA